MIPRRQRQLQQPRIGRDQHRPLSHCLPAQWSSDAKSLLYYVTRAGGTNIWQQPIAGGPAVPLTRFSDERIFRFSASRDQKRWAIVRGEIASDVVLVSERD